MIVEGIGGQFIYRGIYWLGLVHILIFNSKDCDITDSLTVLGCICPKPSYTIIQTSTKSNIKGG